MNQTILTILLPLAGVVVGAFLQSILQLRRERVVQKHILKIKAYTDYLQAAATVSSKDSSKHIEGKILLNDARLRILIYGSSKLIEHIAILDRAGADLNTTEGMRAFLPVIMSMREDNFLKGKIKEEDLTRILFARDTLA